MSLDRNRLIYVIYSTIFDNSEEGDPLNKIEKLIRQHCPNGVEYAKLGDICDSLPRKTLTTYDLIPDGKYPVINSGSELYGRYDQCNNDGDAVVVASRGCFAGFVTYMGEPFWAGGLCYPYRPKDVARLTTKFLYHYLKAKEFFVMNSVVQQSSIPMLNKGDIDQLPVPLPPLPVQQEIVRILDMFNQLSENLHMELNTEQAARQKQLACYQKIFLDLRTSENVPMVPLKDCCHLLDGKRKPITRKYREPGPYPYYGANGIQDYVANYIFDGIYILVGEDGSVMTPSGNPVVTWASGKIWVNNHAHVLAEKPGVLLRYLFHCLQAADITPLVHGNIPKLTSGDLKAIQIPVPPVSAQREIVRTLDKLGSFYHDLSSSLSSEITAVQKQYAYYQSIIFDLPKASPNHAA